MELLQKNNDSYFGDVQLHTLLLLHNTTLNANRNTDAIRKKYSQKNASIKKMIHTAIT